MTNFLQSDALANAVPLIAEGFCYPDGPFMRTKFPEFLAILAVATLVSCGIPGAPQPPSLELPRTVRDLQAVRRGDQVTLTWTTPRETTDRTHIKRLGVTHVCRAVDRVAMVDCADAVVTLPPEHTPLEAATGFTDTLPKQLQEAHASGFATYAVQVENSHGRSAGLSNQVTVPLAPTLPPPVRLLREITARGVVISWEVPLDEMQLLLPAAPGKPHYRLRIYRADKNTPKAAPTEIATDSAFVAPRLSQPNLNVLDGSAEWEHEYLYWAEIETNLLDDEGKATATIEGAASPPVDVFVHDIFPPAVPSGLQAVSAGTPQQPFIDLSWAPDIDSDLAGYNIYRHQESGPPVKINADLVKAPTYRDAAVQPGQRYIYSVSAVDVRSNESDKSAEATEAVQD